ncbi:MAG: metallophosphoesterase [Odoribacteraceae bacterium]|jgi:predicted MPP superfamily phosphohydrolase|nr:metallophosphoesterase [Odoribacteraceae bacterium]
MRTGVVILLVGLLFILLVDAAFYRVTRPRRRWARVVCRVLPCLFAAGLACYHVALPRLTGGGAYPWVMGGVLLLLLCYVPRCVFLLVFFASRPVTRRRWPAVVAGAVSFLFILDGATLGRYRYRVEETRVVIAGLPAAFEGLRVVQISDLHLGSHGRGYPGVRRMVERVNGLEADVVVMTGDVVNNFASEMLPWIDELRGIRARYGKFAVAGNHDYGDYTRWPSAAAKEANLRDFFRNVEACGFEALNNEGRPLVVDGDTLFICGVENWRRPPLPSHGDVARALEGTAGHVVILLSHDPVYWGDEIARHPVALTLSGHTHAMQAGARVGGWRWSPAKYFFPEYNGLYARDGRQLYVSRGVGYLGLPGRFGLPPEITLLKLTNTPLPDET